MLNEGIKFQRVWVRVWARVTKLWRLHCVVRWCTTIIRWTERWNEHSRFSIKASPEIAPLPAGGESCRVINLSGMVSFPCGRKDKNNLRSSLRSNECMAMEGCTRFSRNAFCYPFDRSTAKTITSVFLLHPLSLFLPSTNDCYFLSFFPRMIQNYIVIFE